MKKILIPALAAVMALAACNTDSTSPSVSISGNWNLRTLNGQSLPVQTGPSTLVTGEQLTLNNDGTYNDVVSYSNGTFGSEFGYYTVSNNQITFVDQSDNNFQYTGSISGSVLTTFSGNFTAVYQKS